MSLMNDAALRDSVVNQLFQVAGIPVYTPEYLKANPRYMHNGLDWPVQKKINLLTQNVLEDTDGVLRPPLDGDRSTPSVSSREASYVTFSLY